MEKEFVPYELALKLKELGFKERCLTYYGEDKPMIYDGVTIHGWDHNTSFLNWTSRPTFSQAFRWFREKHNLYYFINPLGYNMCLGSVGELGSLKSVNADVDAPYGNYQEAELACLDKLIEIITKQQNQ
jgi:hypothetical protein